MYTYKAIIFDMDGTLFKTDTVYADSIREVCEAREVAGLLDKLKEEGYTLCICSNASRQHIDNVLRTFGLTDRFAIIKSRVEWLKKYQLIKQILDESMSCSAIVVGDRLIDFEAAQEAGCLSIGVTYGYGCSECDQADYTADTPLDVYQIIQSINSRAKSSCEENQRLQVPSRVSLIPVQAAHLKDIYWMFQDEEAKEMLGIVGMPSIEDYRGKDALGYAVLDEKGGFIGISELFNISWKNRRAELSITLKPGYRGMGYGSEAIRKLLHIGFQEHGFHQIWLRVLEYNERAIACYRKLGFAEEGRCREESLRRRTHKGQVQMSILHHEWLRDRDDYLQEAWYNSNICKMMRREE